MEERVWVWVWVWVWIRACSALLCSALLSTMLASSQLREGEAPHGKLLGAQGYACIHPCIHHDSVVQTGSQDVLSTLGLAAATGLRALHLPTTAPGPPSPLWPPS